LLSYFPPEVQGTLAFIASRGSHRKAVQKEATQAVCICTVSSLIDLTQRDLSVQQFVCANKRERLARCGRSFNPTNPNCSPKGANMKSGFSSLLCAVLTAIALFALPLAATAQLTTLWQFGSITNGSNPHAALVQGSDGYFYGTTANGGVHSAGTVFRISSAGTLTTLWQFGGSLSNGIGPYATLVQGSDGNFYGTTSVGGVNSDGTVFRISSAGTLTTLWQFDGSFSNGINPYAGLVQGSDGFFYGPTSLGGTNAGGTVFRISSAGTFTTLWQKGAGSNGSPYSVLVQGGDGNFYGTTENGGANLAGSVYRISSAGTLTTFYQFSTLAATNGYDPQSGLVQGSDGYFYGTTANGGTNSEGTVYRISSAGTFTTLWQFGSGTSNGRVPAAGLVLGSDGYFYGTTVSGGTNSEGTVYRISSAGTFTTLYQFAGGSEGLHPEAELVQGSDGYFYGTTYSGGTNSAGTVFRLSASLNPPANQISAIRLSGTNIIFSIPSIAGETYQLQLSSSMNPTNWVNVPVSVTNSIGSILTLTNFGGATGPQGFYRFDITP
jgi:uncharacterized repeat protein (TIGR03803 family)